MIEVDPEKIEADVGPFENRPLELPDEVPPLAEKPKAKLTLHLFFLESTYPPASLGGMLDVIDGVVKAFGGVGITIQRNGQDSAKA